MTGSEHECGIVRTFNGTVFARWARRSAWPPYRMCRAVDGTNCHLRALAGSFFEEHTAPHTTISELERQGVCTPPSMAVGSPEFSCPRHAASIEASSESPEETLP